MKSITQLVMLGKFKFDICFFTIGRPKPNFFFDGGPSEANVLVDGEPSGANFLVGADGRVRPSASVRPRQSVRPRPSVRVTGRGVLCCPGFRPY